MKIKDKIVLLSSRIKDNAILAKTIKNASWLVGDKVFTMAIGILVMALVARYLGPENYGIYNYALAFVTLFTALSTLGLETLSVKIIVQQEEEEGTILFTSLLLRVLGGFFLTLLTSIVIRFVAPNETLVHLLVLVMSFTMIFKSLEVIEYWIQAYQKSKISSLIRMGAYVFSAILKVVFVVLEGSLVHLALIYMSDTLIIGIALVVAYFKHRSSKTKWKFKFLYAKKILSQSWYLVLSGLMVTLYMQIDKVMLGSLLIDKKELGLYSAATQITSMWYFVPLAIITSFKPIIMKKKLENQQSYMNAMQILYSIVAWTGIVFGVIIILSSGFIVSVLYGDEYSSAASIIIISVWAGTFATLGSARSVWLLIEDLQKYTLVYTFAGLIVNVGLNYIMIPVYGGIGASIATLIAQIFANVIILAAFAKTRISSVMITKAFLPKNLFKIRKL
ncbi:flippase [Sutcliffiella horikoshii]|uniref:flippase n=1 Tax=Sutcliffiella horikoshii TaxID=79883 RepID=UPI001CBE4E4F|nr:flippase [Sutcliffiella horikoshii]UAL47156.1 flippase [Sutcliffiella horikoshii]